MKSIFNIINFLCDNAVSILQLAVVAIISVLLFWLFCFLYKHLMPIMRKILIPVKVIFFIWLIIIILTPDPVPWVDEITVGGINYGLHRIG